MSFLALYKNNNGFKIYLSLDKGLFSQQLSQQHAEHERSRKFFCLAFFL